MIIDFGWLVDFLVMYVDINLFWLFIEQAPLISTFLLSELRF